MFSSAASSLAYTATSTNFSSTVVLHGNASAVYPIQNAPPPFPYLVATFGGVNRSNSPADH